MIDSSFLRLAEGSIVRPRRTITAMLLIVAAAAPGLLRLELRTDGHALVPPEDPAVRFDAEVREHFGLRDQFVVLLETSHPDGVYNPATLKRLQRMTEAVAALPEVGPEHVMSLATEPRDRVYPGTLKFRPFLDPLPDTPELIEQLKGDLEAADILTGTLISADARAVTLLAGVPNAPAGRGSADRTALYRRLRAAVEPLAGGHDRVLVVGAPAAESLLGEHILKDLTLLLPLALAVIAAVIWIGCRRAWGVLLGLTEVGACLVFTFGLMGWLGVPIYLTTAVLPVILTTLGLADEIHLFWHYQRLLAGQTPHAAAVRRTFGELTRPVVLTSLTTSLGFLSFLASPIAPVRLFGVFAGVGILFCMLWSLTVIPAALTRLGPEVMRRPSRPAARWPSAAWVGRQAQPLLAALGLLTLGLGLGTARLFVQDSWIDGFAPESPFRQATERVDAALHGTHVLLCHLTFEGPVEVDLSRVPEGSGLVGPLLDPTLLAAVGAFESFLRARPEVGGAIGPHSHLSTAHYLWLARRQGMRRVPGDPQRIRRVLNRLDLARGERRRREIIDDDLRRAVVTIFLENANYRDTARLMAAIRGYQRDHLAARGVRVDFAGDVAVSQAMIPAIVETQVVSLLLALASSLLAVCLLTRSLLAGLAAVAPAALAVLWTFGTMGWLGVPLGVATSMFCAITLGIGIDYAVHFYERFRRARAAGHPAPAELALGEAGPSIIADTLAIALGFGLLGLSQVPANARLGLLVALALTASCLLTLGGLGALLGEAARLTARSARSDA